MGPPPKAATGGLFRDLHVRLLTRFERADFVGIADYLPRLSR
jgi:hypothetical protein